jgi:hypothetical protein
MPTLRVHKDFQAVSRLPFCYLCGKRFLDTDRSDGDHVPPKCTFNVRDRNLNVIKLRTHVACNNKYSVNDKKAGQLIALRRGEGPKSERDRSLEFQISADRTMVGVSNLNVDKAVWRWVRGFHAALYREPLIASGGAIQTPFPRGEIGSDRNVSIQPIRQQHLLAVQLIKANRAIDNIDSIVAWSGKLRYECIWCQSDDGAQWFCMFALDIYDWKDLGSHTDNIPARGCTGVYALMGSVAPASATRAIPGLSAGPNTDFLDPFAP